MRFLRHWKIVTLLVALFGIGMVTGAALTVNIVKKKVRENENWPATTYRLYKYRLKLTPEQEERLRPTFQTAGEELRSVRRQTLHDILEVIRRANVEVEKELTPEQKIEFEKLREEIRLKLEERIKSGKGA